MKYLAFIVNYLDNNNDRKKGIKKATVLKKKTVVFIWNQVRKQIHKVAPQSERPLKNLDTLE